MAVSVESRRSIFTWELGKTSSASFVEVRSWVSMTMSKDEPSVGSALRSPRMTKCSPALSPPVLP